MELPDYLKSLYRHWDFHTENDALNGRAAKSDVKPRDAGGTFKDKKLLREISWFVRERIDVWKKKTAGHQPPFTDDSILSTYRFCNVFREFDRQTMEFHELLNPIRGNFPLWLLNMFYCRMVARTETVKKTVEAAGFLSFDKKENKKIYETLMGLPRPRFGTPYVFPVSVIQRSETPTRETFIAEYLPSIMEKVAGEISGWQRMPVHDGVERVLPIFKYNLRFLWTEVLIDVAYQYPERVDLFARFPIGPGSMPTMERMLEAMNGGAAGDSSDVSGTKDAGAELAAEDSTLLVTQLSLLIPIDTGLTFNGKPLRLSAENWEGIGCEFRKYTNLKNGKGRRRIFRPRA